METVLKFTPIEEEQTKIIINNLKPKKSAGYDYISQILYKASVDTLPKILAYIINQSLTTSRFPNKLKIAKIIPIFKKDDKHDFNNYISLLPSISKVFLKNQSILKYFSILL